MTRAYELVSPISRAAGTGNSPATVTVWAIGVCALFTSDHTFVWSLSAMALLRTEGAAISAPDTPPGTPGAIPNLSLVPTHRPGSTQNTLKSMGSLSAGTMRSLPITRSCLPPVTISPANNNRGRLELFTSTNWFTWAFSTGIGREWRRIIERILPDSVTTTSPDRRPSSRVRNSLVSNDLAATMGNTVRLPCRIGARTLYSEVEVLGGAVPA